MPQIFQVLKCYKCSVFQVHLTKKSSKWECKLCGEKQSVKRHYGIGSSSECRIHVQKLNKLQGDREESKLNSVMNLDSDDSSEDYIVEQEKQKRQIIKIERKSKWDAYVKENEVYNDNIEPEYYEGTEVVLQIPKKLKHTMMYNEQTPDSNDFVEEASNCNSNKPNLYQKRREFEQFASLQNTERVTKSDENITCYITNNTTPTKQVTNMNVSYHQVNKHEKQSNNVNERKSKWAAYINENENSSVTNQHTSIFYKKVDSILKPNEFVEQFNPLIDKTDNTTILHSKFVYEYEELTDKPSRTQHDLAVYSRQNTNHESDETEFDVSEEEKEIIPKSQNLFCLCDDTDLDDILSI